MILALTLALAPHPNPPAPVVSGADPGPALSALSGSSFQVDHEKAIADAGEDIAKLTELATAWKEAGESDAARAAWRRILELDENNELAHKGLRHHSYDGKWFETYTALSKYRRAEEARMKEKGLVRFGDEWVPTEDVRYLRLGWVKGDDGQWVSPALVADMAERKEKMEAGWVLQDLTWIEPSEASRIKAGAFKCGEEWLKGDKADAYHAHLNSMWEIPGEHFVLYTTLPRTTKDVPADWALWWAESTYPELMRIFGVKPGAVTTVTDLRGPNFDLPGVIVLSNVEQYNLFAAGSQDPPRPPAEQEGFSSLHYAFFADSYITQPRPGSNPVYRGQGVGLWAIDDSGMAPYGQYAIRHAAAHSFAEAIDPSWDTIGNAVTGQGQPSSEQFWQEKRIPRWLRYGAASFVERYMIDPNVGDGGDPQWIRKWGMQNLVSKGGVGDLEELFRFNLSLDDIDASTQRIHRAGAVVAYMLDGGDEEVGKAHEAFKAALRSGDDTSEAAAALEAALKAKAKAIEKFCQ